MKRILAALLAICLTTGIFTGCSSQSIPSRPHKGNPVTITFWHYYNGAQKSALDQMIQEFNETEGLEKGIIVEAVSKGRPNQLAESVMDSIACKVGSDPLPNIFQGYADAVYQVDRLGLVVSLDDYLTEEELAEYVPGYLEEGRMGEGEHLKILPIAKATEILTLNLTDWGPFAAATGHTLEELAVTEQVTSISRDYYRWTDAQTPEIPNDGRAFFGRDALANYIIIGCMQMGSEVFQVEGDRVIFQTDEATLRRLWENYYVPMVNGWFCAKGNYRSDDAKVGELLAQVGSTSSCFYFPTEVTIGNADAYPIEVVTLPAPVFAGGVPYAVQQGAGVAVMAADKEEEIASVEFLKWFTETDRNLLFAIESGYIPVTREGTRMEKLETFLQSGQTVERPHHSILESTLRTAYETAQQELFYTNQAFENGTRARNVLETLLSSYLQKDMAQVAQWVDQGMSREDAAALVATEERFQQWLQELRTQLAATQA